MQDKKHQVTRRRVTKMKKLVYKLHFFYEIQNIVFGLLLKLLVK